MSVCSYLSGLVTPTAYGNTLGGALSTASGYSSADLVDGTVERFWRTGLTAATDFNIAFDLGAAGGWDTVAVFDVRATDGTLPTAVQIDFGSSMSVWPGVDENLTMNSRGDGWLQPTETITRYVLIHVAFASAKLLRIGEIAFGTKTDLTRQFTDRSDMHDARLVENESAAGSVYRARVGKQRRVLSLAWDKLTETERAELAAMFTDADDGLQPTILLPDSYRPEDIFHGRLPTSWSEVIDEPLFDGISFDFVESGRAL